MASLFYSFVASVLLAQAVYSQCGLGIHNGLIGNNLALAGNNLGYGNNAALAGNNLALAGNTLGLGGNGINNVGIFAVESASPSYNYPAGVVVTSENQIGGQVAVSGALPFLGSAYFGGDVASGGEGSLAYGAGPSVSLNGGGCGNGLGGSGSAGYGFGNSLRGASIASSGFGGASILNSGLSTGCSCGRNGLNW